MFNYFDSYWKCFKSSVTLGKEDLSMIFKSRYRKCAKEWRINMTLYELCNQIVIELKRRGEDEEVEKLKEYAANKASNEAVVLRNHLSDMGVCEERINSIMTGCDPGDEQPEPQQEETADT